MRTFEQACRPVMFESNIEGFEYWGKGSSILLANSKHFYWVTAKHVVEDFGANAFDLRIFPSDKSRISLPYNEKYTIKSEELDDEDYKDLYILKINIEEFEKSGDAPLIAQDLELGVLDPVSLTPREELYIIGYPGERTIIDHDESKITQTRVALRGLFDGASISDHCYKALIESDVELESYDGLSGSPVFVYRERKIGNQIVVFPLLVGLILRGTSESRIVHFLSIHVILNAVRCAEAA